MWVPRVRFTVEWNRVTRTRPRLTVRRLMAAVAVLACLLAAYRFARTSLAYRSLAAHHARQELALHDQALAEPRMSVAAALEAQAARHARLKAAYRGASWRPWERVTVDRGPGGGPGRSELHDGLARLLRGQGRRVLDLRHAEVTDEDLGMVKDKGGVRAILLQGTAVTDAGLVHLEDLARVETVDLFETGVSLAGARRLARRLPHARIHH